MAMVSLKLTCIVIMCVAVMGAAPVVQAITCSQVTANVAPCITYLTGGGAPSPGCCAGVKSAFAAATTTPARRAICNCLKSAAGGIPGGINDNFAQALPAKCGVNIPFKISVSTNCASIN
ncbi:non-specific lipid-transfer protein 1-like [Lotus japonicus]|uniref:non-specific lipid-transfer protein 1-like n=1 Tax=Lotus japonicus TaxID=34305 RepID=UPI0025854DA5|nr:non-specific lipid-transfer protein 1-like [Lotus japonicus]